MFVSAIKMVLLHFGTTFNVSILDGLSKTPCAHSSPLTKTGLSPARSAIGEGAGPEFFGDSIAPVSLTLY